MTHDIDHGFELGTSADDVVSLHDCGEIGRTHVKPTMSLCAGYASTTDLADHWKVDRRTVPAILSKFGVVRSSLHKSPRYKKSEILLRIDKVPAHMLAECHGAVWRPLLTTSEVADALDVSAQTVRNYVASGRLHTVALLDRTPRFHPSVCGL